VLFIHYLKKLLYVLADQFILSAIPICSPPKWKDGHSSHENSLKFYCKIILADVYHGMQNGSSSHGDRQQGLAMTPPHGSPSAPGQVV